MSRRSPDRYPPVQSRSGHFRVEDDRRQLAAPFTQASIAAMFLLERGCIERTRGRRYRAGFDFVYEDALSSKA